MSYRKTWIKAVEKALRFHAPDRTPKPSGVIITFRDGRYFETGLNRFVTLDEIDEFRASGLMDVAVWLPDNGREDYQYEQAGAGNK